MALLSLFQDTYIFKGVVFTNSFQIKEAASIYNLDVLPIRKRSKFKMPVIRDLLLSLQKKYSSSFYGYMNSDILMNPRVFDLLPITAKRMKNRQLPLFVELASRVKVVESNFHTSDFDTIQSCIQLFHKPWGGYFRSLATAVCCRTVV